MIPVPHKAEDNKTRLFGSLPERLPAFCRAVYPALASFLCLMLLPFIRWFDIPSPFAAAYLTARKEKPDLFALLGLAASLTLRLLWGLPADWWQYAGCAAVWLLLQKRLPSGNISAALYTLMGLLPRLIGACFTGTAWDAITAAAALPLGMLCAFVMHHSFEEWQECYAQPRARERFGAQLMCLMLLSALGFFRIANINLGQLFAVAAVLMAAVVNGSGFGAAAGLICGFVLVMSGHDYRLVFPLCLCGLLGGVRGIAGMRWLQPPLCAVICLLTGSLTPAYRQPIPWLTGLLGGALHALCIRSLRDKAELYLSGLLPGNAPMENDFVSQRIAHMRDAVDEIARALPRPDELSVEDSEALGTLLCASCANREMCWNRTRKTTEELMNQSMELAREGVEVAAAALPALRRHGCLRAGEIDQTARQAVVAQKKRRYRQRKAEYEQTLTMTHLCAMSGTLSELSALAAGQSAGDLQAAHVISLALDELRLPARLCYARRVDGHLQVALEMNSLLSGRRAVEGLVAHLAEKEDLSLSITRAQKGRIELEETPVYSATVGTAAMGAGGNSISGDACVAKHCDGGRLLMVLCDGMGHGQEARNQSEKTLELLQLLLEAGYSRRQAIVAVNGIMLSAGQECFSTVDLCDVDLWTGHVLCEKLGACATWVVRGDHLKKVEASSLPLGILEEAKPCHVEYTLHSGDILLLMSDGVAEAFRDEEDLKHAILESLYIQPQRMADALLRAALLACGETPRDDMTVMVLLMLNRQHAR